MKMLSGGTFEMETVLNEEEDTEENIIVQNVTVNSFYISKYEVTQREYENVMKKNPSYFKGPNLPVENVSWFDAIEYCNALSRREGLALAYTITGTGSSRVVTWNRSANGYRLPTEEEWVYACRANTTTPFNTGKSINRNMSNYFGRRTVNIGSYQPNAWGLYDMHGNVSEWCWNLFNTSSSSSETRIIRGGSWLNTSMRLRTSFRDHYFPNMRTMSIGFRIAQNF
jgi:formylglycine-generating enzyme required for sulfatase activity